MSGPDEAAWEEDWETEADAAYPSQAELDADAAVADAEAIIDAARDRGPLVFPALDAEPEAEL